MKILNVMIFTSIILITACSEDDNGDKVWRIKSVVGAGDNSSTFNVRYNKANAITSIDQVVNGITVTFYPEQDGDNIILNYEGVNGAATRIFTFISDSTLSSIYDANSTDINNNFFYEPYNGYNRMAGSFRSNVLSGDTTSMHRFIWSGNEIPNLLSYGYIDGIRDTQAELINMISEEVVNPTYQQFPVELSAVMFHLEEFLLYGLANPAKFQIKAETTTYSNLQFDLNGHWIGYTRRREGSANQDVSIVWEEVIVNQ